MSARLDVVILLNRSDIVKPKTDGNDAWPEDSWTNGFSLRCFLILERGDRLRSQVQVKENTVMLLEARERLRDHHAVDVGYAAAVNPSWEKSGAGNNDVCAEGRGQHGKARTVTTQGSGRTSGRAN